MKEKIKKFLYGTGIIGWIVLSITASLLLIIGGVKLFEFIYPILEKINNFTWAIVWLLVFLSIIPRFRNFTGIGIIIGTYIGGAIYWFICFYITYSLWGLLGALIGVFSLVGVYFTAIFALLFEAQFSQAFFVILTIIQIFFLRWLGYWITTKYKAPTRGLISEEYHPPEKYVAVPAKKLSKKPISLGITFLIIYLFIFGVREIFDLVNNPPINMMKILLWGILPIVSGVGLLLQKFWAYRLTQLLAVVSIIIAVIAPIFINEFKNQRGVIIFGAWIVINGLILWYLSRKNIREQFLEPIFSDDEINKL